MWLGSTDRRHTLSVPGCRPGYRSCNLRIRFGSRSYDEGFPEIVGALLAVLVAGRSAPESPVDDLAWLKHPNSIGPVSSATIVFRIYSYDFRHTKKMECDRNAGTNHLAEAKTSTESEQFLTLFVT